MLQINLIVINNTAMSFYDVMLSPPYQVKVSEAESGYVHLTVWKKLDQTYELTSIELNKTAEDQL